MESFLIFTNAFPCFNVQCFTISRVLSELKVFFNRTWTNISDQMILFESYLDYCGLWFQQIQDSYLSYFHAKHGQNQVKNISTTLYQQYIFNNKAILRLKSFHQ
ncbi:hypothetical protein M9Y10_041829 [Tritrichomonas musculus]|uniref:Uncharacterized protein n=1 Tax=Tritrichomonas musculus TaxID=1915356 RepID=A0ABR2K616_9EUKA